MKMNKKKWIILGCGIAVIGVVVLILILTGRKEKTEKVSLFADSDYPLEYYKKDGGLIFLLHGSRSGRITSSGLFWEASVADDTFAEVSADGKEEGGNMTYIVQPKNAGKTELVFIRKTEVEDFAYEAVRLTIPVYIAKTDEGLTVSCGNDYTIEDAGGDIGGTSTDAPYVLMNEKDGTGKILFVKGLSDWEITGDEDVVTYQSMGVDEGGNIFYQVAGKNADVGGKKETTKLTISSEKNKVEEIINVTVDAEGRVSLKLEEKEEQK